MVDFEASSVLLKAVWVKYRIRSLNIPNTLIETVYDFAMSDTYDFSSRPMMLNFLD